MEHKNIIIERLRRLDITKVILSVEELESYIFDLENQFMTKKSNSEEEKRFVATIRQLRDIIPFIHSYHEAMEEVRRSTESGSPFNDINERLNAIRNELDILKRDHAKNVEILSRYREEDEAINVKLNELFAEFRKKREFQNTIIAEQKAHKEQFAKEMNHNRTYLKRKSQLESLIKRTRKDIEDEKAAKEKERQERLRQLEEARRDPYETDKLTIDQLINYLNKLQQEHKLVENGDNTSKESDVNPRTSSSHSRSDEATEMLNAFQEFAREQTSKKRNHKQHLRNGSNIHSNMKQSKSTVMGNNVIVDHPLEIVSAFAEIDVEIPTNSGSIMSTVETLLALRENLEAKSAEHMIRVEKELSQLALDAATVESQ